jgi:predicted nucleotidyltransferase component of viral defense system
MKEISSEQNNLILAASAEGHIRLPPAAVEKDILLTEILNDLYRNFQTNYSIALCGGTSLVKCFGVVKRMSEDLDFKLIGLKESDERLSKGSLSELKSELQKSFIGQGFSLLNKGADNSNKHFYFDLQYRSTFDQDASLRETIKIEFTVSDANHTTSISPLNTLLYKELGRPEANAKVNCISIEQTIAEKVLSFLRRSNQTIDHDPRIIRHVYDVNKILTLNPDFEMIVHCFSKAYFEDEEKFGKSNFKNIPDFIDGNLLRLMSDQNLERDFNSFVNVLTFEESMNFKDHFEGFVDLAELIARRS